MPETKNTTNTNSANAASNAPDANGLHAQINALETNARTWEANELKASNTKLHGLLQEIYGLYKQLMGDRKWRDEVSAYLESVGRPVRANTPFMGKLVRAVFDDTKHNVTPWIGVLNIAKKQKVAEADLAKWLVENGGVHGVRRKFTLGTVKEPSMTREQLIEKAVEGCKSLPGVTVADNFVRALPDFENAQTTDYDFVVALAVRESGKLRVVHHTAAKVLVDEYLSRLGKVVPEHKHAANSNDEVEVLAMAKKLIEMRAR